MNPRTLKDVLRYSLAVGLCLLALTLRWLLASTLGDVGPFITMFPMVVFATLLCGIGPGIVATFLAAVSANALMYATGAYESVPLTEAVARTGAFLALCGMVNWMASNRCPVRMLLGEPSADAEKRAEISERELRSTEERLRMAETVSGYGTWEMEIQTGAVRWSDGIYELTRTVPGSEPPEVLWRRALGEQALEEISRAVERAVREKQPEFQFEAQLTRSDGSTCWITTKARIIYDEAGSAVRVIGVNFDVTKRKESELEISELNKELRKRISQLRAIFDIAPVGIAFAEDPKCNVITANRALAAMVGVRPDDNVSLNSSNAESVPYKHIKDGRELTKWELPMQRAVAEKRPILDEEIDILRADGRTVSMLASASPVFDSDGNVIGCVATQVDITETKRLVAELQRKFESEKSLRREAEDANKIKDQFLATVSHELRTPLNSIAGWVAVLLQGEPSSETLSRGLHSIQSATKAQTRLITDLLELSRIVTGGFGIEHQPVELVPVMMSAVESLRPAAEEKKVSVEIDADPSVEAIIGDECRLEQVLLNLLHNAIKFSFDGGQIQVGLHRDGTAAVITVRDHGRGIGKGFLPFVFDTFRQEDDSIAKSFSGLGLGLAIAKRLVELHGGTIAVDSKGEGEGSTFTVRLPMKGAVLTTEASVEVVSKEERTGGKKERDGRLDGKNVLVVDDEEDSREVLKIFLEQSGASVRLAGSSADALREIEAKVPDILISDIGMPDEDGYGLIRKVRALEGPAAEIPAIAVTAFARYEDRSRALIAGFDDHIAKPIEPSVLVEIVVGLLRK